MFLNSSDTLFWGFVYGRKFHITSSMFQWLNAALKPIILEYLSRAANGNMACVQWQSLFIMIFILDARIYYTYSVFSDFYPTEKLEA